MTKVLIIHGFAGSPNGNWKPWLLAELEKLDIYASSISLPNPTNPIPESWVDEIERQVNLSPFDKICLIGHSLGSTAILRYLESKTVQKLSGVILISGPCQKNENRAIDNFLEKPFDFSMIKSNADSFSVIHSDNDPYVPIENAQILTKELNAKLTIVSGGGHFASKDGYFTFPQVLRDLQEMLKI